jgi:hypothetical protein
MAKELPYFQFEPAEYLAGNIQLCSLSAQGLFINIQALYWIRDCKLTLSQCKRKFREDELIDELIEENVLKLSTDNDIIISYLDSQREMIIDRKIRLSNAGKKGAEAKKNRATVKPTLNHPSTENEATLKQPNKIREEEIKEEKIKVKESVNNTPTQNSFDSLKVKKEDLNDRLYLENLRRAFILSEKQIEVYIDQFWLENSATFEPNKSVKDLMNHFKNWLKYEVKREKEKKQSSSGSIDDIPV